MNKSSLSTQISKNKKYTFLTISTSTSRTLNFLQVNNIFEDYNDFEQTSETSFLFNNNSANIIEIKEYNTKYKIY
ncbi:6608_t:CDS:2 [Scutellospora calospora]|uniref:6608_t:CDS:1 n=1 Tax=Scutellospora calospora TaxID=85575 RepID=A0ACA9JTY3_9GLOM|nr:6608_t:CDS:2 [Scutellospora calospora]